MGKARRMRYPRVAAKPPDAVWAANVFLAVWPALVSLPDSVGVLRRLGCPGFLLSVFRGLAPPPFSQSTYLALIS